MAALNRIKIDLANKIRNVQKWCAPYVLEDGIKRIPDEILAHIFEAGHQMPGHPEFAVRISHVCSRFRQVSLRTPLLWTRLSSKHPNDQTEAYLTRSVQSDLQVTLSDLPADKLRSFLQRCSPHSGRWSRLLLLLDPWAHGIIDEVASTHFPRLRSIFHHLNVEPTALQWNMPSLTQFGGFCSQFPPDASFPFLLQLTSMDLCFSDYDSFDMASLGQVLYKMLNLRNLSLEFQDCDDADTDEDYELEPPEPHSFHIDSLKITFRDSIATNVAKSLYEIIEHLTATRVDISLLMHGDPHEFLNDAGIFHYGTTIRLQFGLPCSLSLILDMMLQNSKILRSLLIENTSFNPIEYIPHQWQPFLSLSQLQFYDCIMLEEENVGHMARALLASEEFQLLELISCHKISEEYC
ncbi:hypothetical protein BD410DRAFT_844545 [Rickenella mellea]|uniref:F-box domain-containing protein n=1 Tax=Rickenella mellea TaxID=50990 RepID=A0A4Y7PMJ1_9AGAM|nr:hypothetical protein BD410DRAFT_844545 [Rickenella mellea]